MSNKKSKLKRLWPVLIALVFFLGVGFIVYPLVSNLISITNANTAISEYKETIESLSDDDTEEMLEKARKFNEDLFGGTINSEYATCLNTGEYGLMCYLDIPSINVYLPVYYGTSDEVLEMGCGYVENTSLPVGGESTHSVIAGHTGLPTAEMLTELDKLEIGDVFYIHVLDEVLAYEVDYIHVVQPDDVEELGITEGEDYVTLLTCTPYGINDKRLLVRGTRIEYDPDNTDESETDAPSDDSDASANAFWQLVVIISVIVAALLIFAAVLIIYFCSVKKSRKSKEIKPEPPPDN